MDATEAVDAATTVCDRLWEMLRADPDEAAEISPQLLIDAMPLLHYLERTSPHYGMQTGKRLIMASEVPAKMGTDLGVWTAVVALVIEDLRRFIRDESRTVNKAKGGKNRGRKPKKMNAQEKQIKEMHEQDLRPQEIDTTLGLDSGTARRVLHRLKQREKARAC